MGKIGSALFCLLFAVSFGGVGAWATYTIAATLQTAWQSRDWVKVRATIDAADLRTGGGDSTTHQAQASYRYRFNGQQYSGTRLGVSALGGSDNIDDWHEQIAARLADARTAGIPITVFVNPVNPAEAVVDRAIRWKEILFLTPFSVVFGGVGIGAFGALLFVLRGKSGTTAQTAGAGFARVLDRTGKAGGKGDAAGLAGLWIFTVMWNAIAIPIAAIAVPEMIESGEYAGLFVLLFPLVGMFLLWGALAATWRVLRGGAVDPAAAGRRERAASLPANMAAQAAQAMFEPKAPAPRDGFGSRLRLPARAGVPIPPSLAVVEEGGGVLRIRYARMRSLGMVAGLFFAGAFLITIGVAFFAAEGLGVPVVLLFFGGTIAEVFALAMLVGSLEVTVKGRELLVEKGGLFGRKSWTVRRDEITAVRPALAYTVNDVPYFTVHAIRGAGGKIPVGTSIRGEELANTIAQRVARALGLSATEVAPAQNAGTIATDS
jgi:hypothetical protein